MRTATRWLLLGPAILILGGLFGGALLFTLLIAIHAYPSFDPQEISFSSFAAALADPALVPSLGWTLYVALASTLAATILGVLVAWSLLRVRAPALHLLARAPILVPHLVASLMMLTLLSGTGLLSRMASALGVIASDQAFPILVHDRAGIGMILTYTWKEAPFVALVALTAMRSIDDTLLQQARNLGATEWRVLRYVQLPLIKPALAAASLIVFAFAFGSYEVPALLDRLSPGMLSVLATDGPRAMASALLLSLLALALTVIYLRLLEQTRRARWS